MDKKLIGEAIAHIQSDRKGRAIEILEGLTEDKPNKRFTLVIKPDGKCLLTTEETIQPDELHLIAQAFMSWREKANDILILGNTQVVTVMDIKLELPQGQSA